MAKRFALLFLFALSHSAFADALFFSPDCFSPPRPAQNIEAAMAHANEISLYSQGPAPSIRNSYRLTVMPEYSNEPALIVRLDVAPEARANLVSYVFRNTVKPVASTSPVTSNQAREFEHAYLSADFTPVSYPKIEIVNGRQIVTIGIRGGHYWVFEAFVNGKYRCVHRSAHEEGTFRDLVRSLLRFAGKDNDEYR